MVEAWEKVPRVLLRWKCRVGVLALYVFDLDEKQVAAARPFS